METKSLLGFNLSLLKIDNFKNYYKNCNSFSSFSEKSFLKSIAIPPPYFKEQPNDTQKELLENKEEVIQEKYSGQYIVLLEKDDSILNCCRLDYAQIDFIFNKLSTQYEDQFVPIRDHINEGYYNYFIPYKGKHNNISLEKGKYNLGFFLDFPILLNKQPVLHTGYYYIPNEDEDFSRCLYFDTYEVNYSEYQDLDILITDYINKLNLAESDSSNDMLSLLKLKQFNRDYEEVLIKLSDLKVFSLSRAKKISKYITKNEIQFTSVLHFIDVVSTYDKNFSKYKQLKSFRQLPQALTQILNDL